MADYFENDDVFRDVNKFYKLMMERMLSEMEDFEKAVDRGQLRGNWKVKTINKPGVKGYIAERHFESGSIPTDTPMRIFQEEREPLTDVFDEKEYARIYVELPGIDKSDIQLDVGEGFVEVKANNLIKRVRLPADNLNFEKTAASYRNGVLEVTIPKLEKTDEDERKRSIKIE